MYRQPADLVPDQEIPPDPGEGARYSYEIKPLSMDPWLRAWLVVIFGFLVCFVSIAILGSFYGG